VCNSVSIKLTQSVNKIWQVNDQKQNATKKVESLAEGRIITNLFRTIVSEIDIILTIYPSAVTFQNRRLYMTLATI